MSSENNCPFCGAPLGTNPGNTCSSCGNALPFSSNSAPTMISHKSDFNNSAEVMDEIKNLIKEDKTEAAAEIAAAEFELNADAANRVIEQTAVDLKYSSASDALLSEPEKTSNQVEPEIIDAPINDNIENPSKKRFWIIAGSIAAGIFLCCCCCLVVFASIPALMQKLFK
jgi:uncharacterized Zn finger protein (UPF0148 family)